jgi:hypothetical protein
VATPKKTVQTSLAGPGKPIVAPLMLEHKSGGHRETIFSRRAWHDLKYIASAPLELAERAASPIDRKLLLTLGEQA